MRRTHIAMAVAAAVILCAFALPALTQSPVMTIDNKGAYPGGKERGPVMFKHDQHVDYGYDCTVCHKDGDTSTFQGIDPKTTPDLRAAYHQACWGCHEKTPPAKHGYGPRACAGCHEVK
jgi:hypothetical protein